MLLFFNKKILKLQNTKTSTLHLLKKKILQSTCHIRHKEVSQKNSLASTFFYV